MFVTKRWCFDFATLFCQYQVCLKCRKLVYESFSVNENSSAMSDNERLHLFPKDEKGYPFLSIGSCSDKTKKGTLFLSILLSLKTIGKGVKFQDITLIRATLTNTIAAKDSRCTLSAIYWIWLRQRLVTLLCSPEWPQRGDKTSYITNRFF